MNDLRTIVSKNVEARHLHDAFVLALSKYGDALKRGDLHGNEYHALRRAAAAHAHFYGDTSAARRLTNGVGAEHYRAQRFPVATRGTCSDQVV